MEKSPDFTNSSI